MPETVIKSYVEENYIQVELNFECKEIKGLKNETKQVVTSGQDPAQLSCQFVKTN